MGMAHRPYLVLVIYLDLDSVLNLIIVLDLVLCLVLDVLVLDLVVL